MTAQVFATPRTQPQLIVLHLMGSHPQACDRTDGKYADFVQSKETSCYLYTMTQTDDLLSKLYDQLRNTGDSFSVVYFSDHGLAFKERGKEVQYPPMTTSSSRTSVYRLWCCRVMIKRIA